MTSAADFVPILDTSGWQSAYASNGKIRDNAQPFDFAKAQQLGVQGVIHRIGNGNDLDESFRLAYDSVRETDMAIGAYYYVQPNFISAADAAALIESWIAAGEYELDLPIMLDLETYNGSILDKHQMGKYIRNLALALENKLGRKPMIYTGAWWWNEHVDGDFTGHLTIQARYPRHGVRPPSDTAEWADWALETGREPRPPAGLGAWDGWQFTADLNPDDFGIPADRVSQGLDGNIIRERAWREMSVRPLVEPTLPKPEPEEEKVDMTDWPPFRPAQGAYSLYPFDLNKPVTKLADKSNVVKYIQGVIKKKAGGNIKVDGIYGPKTAGRVSDVQALFEVTVDGITGWGLPEGEYPATRADAGKNSTFIILDWLAGREDSKS